MRDRGGARYLLTAVALLTVWGCAGIPRPRSDAGPEERMRYAWRLLESGRTFQAKEVFQELVYLASGSTIIDSVYYGLAESHLREKSYFLAQNEYRNIVRSYRRSPLVDDAAFKIGLCYWELSHTYKLDQTETYQAFDEFRAFLQDYPSSELADQAAAYRDLAYDKLARKKIYEGETYLRLGTDRDLGAALRMFQEAGQIYPDTSHLDLALWGVGETYYRMGEGQRAMEAFVALVANYPDSRRLKAARKRIEKLRREGIEPGAGIPPS